MANWSTEPGLNQTWANFLAALKARDEANAKMDYSGESNIPTGTIRWNTSTNLFERWDGATWSTAVLANAVPTTRTITAGSGLTGGGALSSNITLNVGAGTGISVTANAVGLDTSNTRNVDHASVSILAGTGLTGGGTLTTNRTLSVNESAIGTETNTPSRVVRRNASGHVFATNFNQESSNAENPSISQIIVTNGLDNYFRKASLAHLMSSMTLSSIGGTLANGQITAGNITQHQASINHNALSNYVSEQHRHIYVSASGPSGGSDGQIWLQYV